jgi:hypothetical protein
MRVLNRRTLWLSALLMLVIVGGVWLLSGRSRITQAEFDRIQAWMSEAEVIAHLGEPELVAELDTKTTAIVVGRVWRDGPNWIIVRFTEGNVTQKRLHLASAWETLTWSGGSYVKKGAAKLGVKWE